MTSESTKARISQYLGRFFPVQDLKDDDDLFALGFVNSMFAIQLVSFVEHEFGIEVENEDLEMVNFSSLGGLEAFVTGKLVASAVA